MTFAGCDPISSHGASDIFLARVDSTGSCRYAASFGDEQAQCYPWCELDLWVTATGEVVLAGAYYGVVDFGAGPMVSGAISDGFVALFEPYAAAGTPQLRWSLGFGDAQEQRLYAAAQHGEQLVVSGLASGTFSLGSFAIADETFGKDVVVAGIDLDGEVRWLEQWHNDALQQDTNDRAGARVAARDGHGIAVGGGFRGELTIGDRRLTSSDPSGYDGFVVKMMR
jgi:hypothetical protein